MRDMNVVAYRSRLEAFTLVKLPAVIVIVTVGGLRKRAQDTACMSNPASARLSLRHSDRHNIVMVNGHVESLSEQGLHCCLVKTSDNTVRPF